MYRRVSNNVVNDKQLLFLRNKYIKAARIYKRMFIGFEFAILCDDGTWIKCKFKKKDFAHFTGATLMLNDIQFFDNCYKGTLSTEQISDKQHYNWNTLKKSANQLEKLDKFLYADVDKTLYVTCLHTNTKDFPFAIINTYQNICFAFLHNNCAHSLRAATNSVNYDNAKQIYAVFAKKTCSKSAFFSELIYYYKDASIFMEEMMNQSIDNRLPRELMNQNSAYTQE